MKYFSFQEFERSDTAYRHAIDNTVVSGKLTGTLTLNRSMGIWTVKL